MHENAVNMYTFNGIFCTCAGVELGSATVVHLYLKGCNLLLVESDLENVCEMITTVML